MNREKFKLILENQKKLLSICSLIIGTFLFINVNENLEFINVINIYNTGIILIISLLCLIPNYKIEELKLLTYWFSVGLVILTTIFTFIYNGFSQIEKVNTYLNTEYLYTNILNINIGYGVDGISIIFIWLTTILIMSCILISWNVIKTDIKFYLINLLIIELLLINFFVVTDLVHFYIIYESILIPIVIMISMWGSREEKKLAAYQIFVYTLIGSVFMLASVGYLYYSFGTTDYFLIKELISLLPLFMQRLVFLGFFIGFAVKIPIVPLHLWLLRAHVEAPTAGSVLLAGILLKLGGYGFLRFNIGLLPESCNYFFPLIVGLSLISILYTGIATVMQLDIKRIIAYSSISHMNVVVLGLFSQVLQGIEGGIYLMVSHGLVSGGLFLCIGVLYEQYKSRLLYSYNNLVHVMPIFAVIFFLLTLANIAFPITSSFIGELLIFCGIIKKNIIVAFFGALGMIVTVIYSFWLYNRIFFDNGMLQKDVKFNDNKGQNYRDINNRELLSIIIMIIFVIIFGIKPNLILNLIENNSINLLSADKVAFGLFLFIFPKNKKHGTFIVMVLILCIVTVILNYYVLNIYLPYLLIMLAFLLLLGIVILIVIKIAENINSYIIYKDPTTLLLKDFTTLTLHDRVLLLGDPLRNPVIQQDLYWISEKHEEIALQETILYFCWDICNKCTDPFVISTSLDIFFFNKLEEVKPSSTEKDKRYAEKQFAWFSRYNIKNINTKEDLNKIIDSYEVAILENKLEVARLELDLRTAVQCYKYHLPLSIYCCIVIYGWLYKGLTFIYFKVDRNDKKDVLLKSSFFNITWVDIIKPNALRRYFRTFNEFLQSDLYLKGKPLQDTFNVLDNRQLEIKLNLKLHALAEQGKGDIAHKKLSHEVQALKLQRDTLEAELQKTRKAYSQLPEASHYPINKPLSEIEDLFIDRTTSREALKMKLLSLQKNTNEDDID